MKIKASACCFRVTINGHYVGKVHRQSPRRWCASVPPGDEHSCYGGFISLEETKDAAIKVVVNRWLASASNELKKLIGLDD